MTTPITAPTLEGFIAWTRSVMGLSTIVIPDDSPGYVYAYQVALDLIPTQLSVGSDAIYALTVYNCGGSLLLQFQQDIPGQTFFADARKAYNMNSFVAGVISSASDEGTSESLIVGKGLQNLQLMDLQRLKDPYGRQAWAYLQTIGTLWGLS